MADKDYILALDQGTTGTTALLLDREGKVAASAYRELHPLYPQPGWVEEVPAEFISNILQVTRSVIRKANISSSQIKGIGIANQRETTLVWERKTGTPVTNAIVWQCRRSTALCEVLKQKGLSPVIKDKTGLVVDAYFSGTKLRWILDNIPDGQKRAEQSELLFGTVDSWLLWNLTGGKIHATEVSNASRTMLFNIHTLSWDSELLSELSIPHVALPEVMPSSHLYGLVSSGILKNVPVAGIAGDQQAALFGQACYQPGMMKNTYGTGSFVLLNTGSRPVMSQKGLLTSVAWELENEVSYVLEGSIFVTGAAVQWLRDGLGIIRRASETEALALSVPDNAGVYFVPAFVGLGAPYWNMYARGTIVGLTRGASRAHLVRATLESIAYQTRDVVDAMGSEAQVDVPVLRVDGKATDNAFLMQFQADILGVSVQVASEADITALGAGYLAGLALGFWRSTDEVRSLWRATRTYEPKMSVDQRESLYADWKRAVDCSQDWAANR